MTFIENELIKFSYKLEQSLKQLLTENCQTFELERPHKLLQAMRYSVLPPGKGIRPFLLTEITKLLDGPIDTALQIGSAVELIHCYSLIHDDLPAMDNDDLRRGKASLHKYYDEATAILSGDALLTLAFNALSSNEINLTNDLKIQLISQLSQAAGIGGMVGGQIYDLLNENTNIKEEHILRTHAMKTGALFIFCTRSAAIISGCSEELINRFESFGAAIGLAFQLADDILDLNGTSKRLGKTGKQDLKNAKSTIATLYGIEEATKQLDGLIKEAKLLLQPFGDKAQLLVNLTDFIQQRQF